MSSIVLIGSPIAFAPIAFEYAVASCIYITLLLKPTTRGNFLLLIASSVCKLLASSAVFTTNLNPLGWANIPFLLFQLLNEVTLLIWVIQRRDHVTTMVISTLYKVGFKALRVVGEVFTIAIICGLGIVSPLWDCPCPYTISSLFDIHFAVCNEPSAARIWSTILTPQVRGLAFVISITAGVVSMSGAQFLLAGFTARIRGREMNALDIMGEDMEWKRKVRGIFSGLTIVVAFLFLGTYLLPGFRQCESDDILEDPDTDDVHMTFNLGALSSSLFNALLAISQMFVSDILFRCSSSMKSEKEDSDSDSQL